MFSSATWCTTLFTLVRAPSNFLVATLVGVFLEFMLAALEVLDQIAQVALGLGTVGFGHHRGIFFVLGLHGIDACFQVLQVVFALLKFLLQLGRGRLHLGRFSQDALTVDDTDTELLGLGSAQRHEAGEKDDGKLQRGQRFG